MSMSTSGRDRVESSKAHWRRAGASEPGSAPPLPDRSGTADRDFLPAKTFQDLFEAQVKATPENPALSYEGTEFSYADLNRAADNLSRYISEYGAGPERTVALLLPKSPMAILAIVAVLKCGAAFIPIDPNYPSRRIRSLLADSRPCLVLTAGGPVSFGLDYPAMSVFDRETTIGGWASHAGMKPDGDSAQARVGNAAYIIYTSGTTGKPKGVVVTHRGIARLVSEQGEAFEVGPGSRVLQFASLSFDAAVSEICMALLRGATLVPALQDRLVPGRELRDLIVAERVTHATLPPAVLPLQEGDYELPAALSLIVAGEACSAAIAERWQTGRCFINGYGPTENTVCVSMARLPHRSGVPVIGRPIRGVQVYLLDGRLCEVPRGASGEIYIAGESLARGYQAAPGLTASYFVANPFGPRGSRLYRTGDVARLHNDGSMEFIGRVDSQISFRGIRIEPTEIEHIILNDPSIVQARVVIRNIPHPGLVAYAVPATGATVHQAGLRRRIADQLPSYMVPVSIVPVDHLPLTANGKLQISALPVPDLGSTGPGIAPRTMEEMVLCKIFADILALPRVSVDDNFFEIGGDSLLATRLVNRIRRSLAVDISVATIIESASPEKISAVLEGVKSRSAFADILPLRRSSPANRPIFLLPLASGLCWSYASLLAHIDIDHDIYGLQAVSGTFRKSDSVEEMAAQLAEKITEMQPEGPYRLIGWSFGAILAYAVAAEIERNGQPIELLCLIDPEDLGAVETEHHRARVPLIGDIEQLIDIHASDALIEKAADRSSAPSVGVLLEESAGGSTYDGNAAAWGTVLRHMDNRALLRNYEPSRVAADIDIFVSTGRGAERDIARPWADRTAGSVRLYLLDCEPAEIWKTDHLAKIGAQLRCRLEMPDTATDQPC
ncbi:amino acid adenylation domain-containing protein [Nocardia sp. NPDC048505]|uniref:amino acid adenylation domain-containing protein n=1 Tax=Nocardia sp. NPDC048505 TaxID=3155756 RepID=UPI00340612E3